MVTLNHIGPLVSKTSAAYSNQYGNKKDKKNLISLGIEYIKGNVNSVDHKFQIKQNFDKIINKQ